MRRLQFLGGLVAAMSAPALAQTEEPDISDPAMTGNAAALRVLLGKGNASRIDATSFLYGGRRFRGTFTTLPDGNVVNTVPLEAYLQSVVSREMPSSWPQAALQTQAIVARTYVLQRSAPLRSYYLVPSEADQVYTGIDAETTATNAAVKATAGQVLRFADGFASVMYSSCCGGHTEASSEAWGGPTLQYLGGVACPYCTDSPWYRWTQNIPLERLRAGLGQKGAQIGEIRNVTTDRPDASGRIRFATVIGDTGNLRIKGPDLRRALGTRTMPSLLVRKMTVNGESDNVPQADPILTIEGGGLGHGVGLCQWGARGLARTGATAQTILSFYYPGTTIGND